MFYNVMRKSIFGKILVETEALKMAEAAKMNALQLSGNSYGTEACLRLAESLEKHPEFKVGTNARM